MKIQMNWWTFIVSLPILVLALEHKNHHSEGTKGETFVGTRDPVEPNWPFTKRRLQGFPLQSPTNIITGHSKNDLCLAPICVQKTASLPEEAVIIKNTGTTLEIILFDESIDNRPTITGGPLFDECYLFEQLHFHWGKKDSCGSEHRIDGRCYSTEVHIVFFKEKYGSFAAAKNFTDGVTVISFFGEHSKRDNPDFSHLVNKLDYVKEPGSEAKGSFKKEFKFVKVLLQQQNYFTFPGSLTTPDYQECVTWIMYTKPFPISSKQLNAFRRLKRQDGEGMIRENDRELQAFGNRPIITPAIKEGIQVRPMEADSPYFEEDECPPNPCDRPDDFNF